MSYISRNSQVKMELMSGLFLTLMFAGAGFAISPVASLPVLVLGLLMMGEHLFFLRKRYRALAELSEEIDRILHGQESLLIAGCDEGELAILTSEVHKMTIRLREQADLLQQDKVRMTDAIADIAHQLRTPLTTMNLNLEVLGREDLDYGKRMEITRNVKRQTQRISWLVEALLKISKIDAGTAIFAKDEISVRELLWRTADPFLIPMEVRGQELEIIAEGESFTGDMAWSIEAIGNLLKNCMEHTPAGGKVVMKATETPIYTQIEVSDSGSGFVQEDIPYLFRRFYKGKNATAESVGIGLALAQMIISTQNGTITADNMPEGGARFTVKFYKSVV